MHQANPIYRFTALLMALLIFISSVGFTIDVHYCNGEFKSFSLIGKAKSCHEKSMSSCPHHQKMMAEHPTSQLDTKGCCQNKTRHFQSDQDKVVQSSSTSIINELQFHNFILPAVRIYLMEKWTTQKLLSIKDYRPPLIPWDIYVLIQSFLL